MRRWLRSYGGLAMWSAVLLVLAYGDALWLPFFFDDFVHLPYVDDYSLPEMWRTAGSLAYYRPFSFTLWKIMHGLLGYHSPVWQHGLNLLLHGTNGFMVGWLAGRLWGQSSEPAWGRAYLSAALFLLFPFSYQAVPWVGSMSHLLVTNLVLISLCFYWAAREGGGRYGYGISLVAAGLAPFAHENGALVGPLLLYLEATSVGGWSWGRVGRVAGRVAWWFVPAVLWLPIWWFAPKGIAEEVGVRSLETIWQNVTYFVQGIAYPLTWLGGWLVRRGVNDMVAAGLLSGLALVGAAGVQWWQAKGNRLTDGKDHGREEGKKAAVLFGRGWLPWLWVGLAMGPAVLFLSFDYVINGPRLLMLASVGAAWLWADVVMSVASRMGRNTDEKRGWARVAWVVVVGLCVALLAQNFYFVRERMGLHQLLAEPYRQAIEGTVAVNTAGRVAALVNLPAWVAPAQQTYALGHEGVLFWPSYAPHEMLVAVPTGQEASVRLVRYEAIRPPMDYVYGIAGRPIEWEPLVASGARFWVANYGPEQIGLRPVGEVPYGEAGEGIVASFPAEEGDEAAVSLLTARAAMEETGVAISLTWQVRTPPAADVTVFVHLVDEQGQLVAQADGDPLGGIWPLGEWPAGTMALDRRWVAWEGSPPAAVYVGIYGRATGTRWPAVRVDGEAWPDQTVRIELTP